MAVEECEGAEERVWKRKRHPSTDTYSLYSICIWCTGQKHKQKPFSQRFPAGTVGAKKTEERYAVIKSLFGLKLELL